MLDNITPEEKSYIIGFLQGDGHHRSESGNRGRIQIELSFRDKDILDKLSDVFNQLAIHVGRGERTRDTNFKKNFSASSLFLCDLELREELREYVPIGKKSRNIKPPIDMLGFNRYAYIRGLSDADGSLGMTGDNKPFWSLCTSSEYIKEFIISDIKKTLNFDKRLSRNKRDGVYNIVLYSEDAVIYTKMLYGNTSLRLDRKYNKFCEIQKWVRTTTKRPGRKKSWLIYEDKVVLSDNLSLKEKCVLLERSPSSVKTRFWRLRQK
ncbi:hypothetical protein LCGC14_1345390 [marine sediment metagenome]|uniref:DOD-type homing endonuclease domain-containing protein n=1 Tax=marine sediment metagenome TaxID=412755 RepID=A0A0F9KYP8_9ZZZZ